MKNQSSNSKEQRRAVTQRIALKYLSTTESTKTCAERYGFRNSLLFKK